MSKYKVGDRVWDNDLNCDATIIEVDSQFPQNIKVKYETGKIDWISNSNYHDTFDTMITRLGFEKYENDVLIQYDKKTETTLGNKTVSIRIIKGKKDYMIWTTDDYIAKMPYGQKIIITNINHDLHEALTQLMRELKANEI